MKRWALALLFVLILPSAAFAQCANGLLQNCPIAVNPQSTDVIYGWQFGQSPHSRSFTLPQILGAGLSNATVTATGGTVGLTEASRWGAIYKVNDQAGVDPTGVSDSTAGIQAAITQAGAAVLFWDAGTYKISSTLTIPNGQRWSGRSKNSVTILWAGANNADVINTSTTSLMLGGGIEHLSISAGSATGVTLLHLRDASNGVWRDLYLNGNNGANNVCLSLEAGVGGTGNAHNTTANRFADIWGNACVNGLELTGIPTGPTVTTNNRFFNVDFEGSTTLASNGIQFVQWTDSNYFYGTRVTQWTAGSVGFTWNSGTPSSNNGVYDDNFFGVAIDAYGTSDATNTGLLMNWTKQNIFYAFYHSPDTYPGTLKNFTANAQSYCVVENNTTVPSNNMQRECNGMSDTTGPTNLLGSLSFSTTSGVGAYIVDPGGAIANNLRLKGSVTGAPVQVGGDGADSNVGILLVPKGSSPVIVGGSAHLETQGTTPGVGSGAGDCGTSPTIAGNDSVGVITVGSSTNGGKCTINFATSWTNGPTCHGEDLTTNVSLRQTTSLVGSAALSGAIVAGDVIHYTCFGWK